MRNDLFDNPMVRSAKASMTPEQIATLERTGEYMHGQVDYETSTLLEPRNLELEVAVESIKSGLSLDYLTDDEKDMLVKEYGENWKTHFQDYIQE